MIIKNNINIGLLKYNALIEMECEYCHKSFYKQQKYIKSLLKLGTAGAKYCSLKCQHNIMKTKKMYHCVNCNKEITRAPSGFKNVFCSHSCSATYSNLHRAPRKKKIYYCSQCGEETTRTRLFCNICYPSKFDDNRTLEEVNEIRSNARSIAKKAGLLNKCKICEYTNCVMACHIKPISSFPKNTSIKEVNDLFNLVGLCPNHHWDLDHELLSKEEKNKIKNSFFDLV